MALQLRRGTEAERASVTPREGELIYVTDTNRLYVGGKVSPSTNLEVGGILVTGKVSEDDNPQLSANLNLNGHNIVGTGNISIDGTITATGNINLGDGAEDNIIVGGQISSSLIPGSTEVYDLGDQAGRWRSVNTVSLNAEGAVVNGEANVGSLVLNGDIKASDSSVIYDAASETFNAVTINAATVNADVVGNLIGEDSVVLVDTTSNTTYADVVNTSVTTSDISGSNIILERVYDDIEGPILRLNSFRGTLEARESMNLGDVVGVITSSAWNGTQYQETGAFVSFISDIDGGTGELSGGCGMVIPVPGTGGTQLTEFAFLPSGDVVIPGKITALEVDADISGSVFADDSTLLVDAVNGEIPGYVKIADLKTALQDGAGDYNAFKAWVLSNL